MMAIRHTAAVHLALDWRDGTQYRFSSKRPYYGDCRLCLDSGRDSRRSNLLVCVRFHGTKSYPDHYHLVCANRERDRYSESLSLQTFQASGTHCRLSHLECHHRPEVGRPSGIPSLWFPEAISSLSGDQSFAAHTNLQLLVAEHRNSVTRALLHSFGSM